MRIVFMGTPDFAVPTLDALIAAGHSVVAAYCQPARPAGRGKAPRPSPVQLSAEAAGIEVRTPSSLRDPEAQRDFAGLGADAAVVTAYGLLLPKAVLVGPRHGALNVHASLLPRWRGAAPIQRAILAGDALTGVSIMKMDEGLDTGPVLAARETVIGTKTAGALGDELAALGAALMIEVLDTLGSRTAQPQPEEGVTYAPKIAKREARLRFEDDASRVERQVRAFNPAPGAFFEIDGERIKLLAANVVDAAGEPGTVLDERLTIACGGGALAPTLVQRAGRGAMTPDELLRGFAIPPGTRLS